MKANKQKVVRLLKTARGQVDGILKMVEEDQYCMDISHQLLAAQAVLKKANQEVLLAHLHSCVKEAAVEGEHADEKIEELAILIDKLLK